MTRFMCVDVETTGLDWHLDVLHGIGVGYAQGEARYYPAWDVPVKIRQDLADPSIAKIGHNLHAFDAKFIRKAGFEINGEFDDTMILANLLDADSPLGLKYLSDKYIGEESLERKRGLDKYMSAAGANNVGVLCAKDLANPSRPHTQVIAEYCEEDVRNTTQLYFILLDKLKELDRVLKGPKFGFKKSPLDYYYEEARPLERVLFEIEYRGIRVDMKVIERIREASLNRMAEIEGKLTHALRNRIPKVEQELHAKLSAKIVSDKNKKPLSPKATDKIKAKRQASIDAAVKALKPGEGECQFKWSNNNHFAALLYRHCDLPGELIFHTSKGAYQTDKAAIDKIKASLPNDHKLRPILAMFAEYKLHQKIASTYTGTNKKGIISKIRYVDGVPRIFPLYRQTTGAGRLACSNPNMQNLKRDSEVKRFFIPDADDEVFDDADYSQIELRTGAHLSQDADLVESYQNGIDVHLKTATRLFGREITKADDMERQAGKRTNFLTIFDGKAARLQAALKADTGRYFEKEACKEFIRIWFETYPGVRAYLDSQLDFFRKYKFCISETGRVRRLPDIYFGLHIEWRKVEGSEFGREPYYLGPSHKRLELIDSFYRKNKHLDKSGITEEMIGWEAHRRYAHAVKAGYNMPIQGLAASMTKRAMIKLHNSGRCIANQVHDSLTVSRKRGDLAARQHLIDTMEQTYRLSVPVVADCKTVNTFHPEDKVKE